MELESDHHFHFGVTPEAFWAAASRTDEYRTWWPWLRLFEGRGLVSGDRWRCMVRPPLRYTVAFTVHLDEVVAPATIRARIEGDIAGYARLAVAPAGDGCDVHLTSSLRPSGRTFRVIALVARPVLRRGHDWILDTGAAQFALAALTR